MYLMSVLRKLISLLYGQRCIIYSELCQDIEQRYVLVLPQDMK